MEEFEHFLRTFPQVDPQEYGVLGLDAVAQKMIEKCWDERPPSHIRQMINSEKVWASALQYGGHDFWAKKCVAHHDPVGLEHVLRLSTRRHITENTAQHLYKQCAWDDKGKCIEPLFKHIIKGLFVSYGCEASMASRSSWFPSEWLPTAPAIPLRQIREMADNLLPPLVTHPHLRNRLLLVPQWITPLGLEWSECFHRESLMLLLGERGMPWEDKRNILKEWSHQGWDLNATPMGHHILLMNLNGGWELSHIKDLVEMGMKFDVPLATFGKMDSPYTLQGMLKAHKIATYTHVWKMLTSLASQHELMSEVGTDKARLENMGKKI